jgi:hypothetical protein
MPITNRNKKKIANNSVEQRDDYPVDLITREAKLTFDTSTIDDENRTIEAIIATSMPVTVVDRTLWEFVDEILDIDGIEMPENRQVPLLDNHSRNAITDIVGSAREIKNKDGVVRGIINFSSLSESAWTLVKERHLTDVSAGYRIYPENSIYIERGCEGTIKGEKVKNTGERTLVYRSKWKIQEVSLTPIGADENAKMRTKTNCDEINRNEKNNTQGEGMPNEIEKQVIEQRTDNNVTPAIQQETINEIAMKRAHEMAEASRTAISNVHAKAKIIGLTDDEAKPAFDGLTFFSSDHERTAIDRLFDIQKKKIEKNSIDKTNIRATIHVDGFDNFRKAASMAIYQTAGGIVTPEEASEIRKTAYGGLTIQSCMRAWLDLNGVSGAGWMSPTAVYQKCVDMRRSFAVTAGDLANVFLDVANKDMARGYAETPGIHEILCGRDTAINFLPKYTIDVTNLGDLEELKTGEGFPMTSLSDSKESVQLKIYALALILDWKAIVNDSMGALVGIPAQLGASARRKEELLFWTFFYGTNMAGPTMTDDSLAMFHATHANFIGDQVTGYGAPTTTTIAAGRKSLMHQTLKSPDGRAETQYTETVPKYIVYHSNLETTVKQHIASAVDIDATTNSNPRSDVPNLDYIRGLIPVQSAYLDAKMDAATQPHNGWYLIGDPRVRPAINKVYLQGQEAPVLRQKNSDVAEPLGTIYDIYHVVNFGQVNYRPVYANYGARQ